MPTPRAGRFHLGRRAPASSTMRVTTGKRQLFSRCAGRGCTRRAASNPLGRRYHRHGSLHGHWLAVEALRQMAIRDGRVAPKIKNVILASSRPRRRCLQPAVRSARQGQSRISPCSSHATTGRCRCRAAFPAISIDWPDRSDRRAYPQRVGKAGSITVLDLTKLKTGDRLNHGKFAESPEVDRS